MKKLLLSTLLALFAHGVMAQNPPAPMPPPAGHAGRQGPPPHAYTDCQGKKAGDAISHATPEGKVAATCLPSPEGLVARPDQPPPRRDHPGAGNPPPPSSARPQ